MVVKNEERRLQACLDSVRALADELIVVDTGSSDSTPKIAAANGALVIPFLFDPVDFAAARNKALDAATGKWILCLDADETLAAESVPLIAAFVARNENAGYYFERHNLTAAAPPRLDFVVRLFPNRSGFRFRGRVHETVDESILRAGGKLHRSAIRIDHYFSDDPESRGRRNRWYIDILKQELSENPEDNSRLDFLAAEYHQLGMFREAAMVTECMTQVRPTDARAHLNNGIYHLMYQSDPVQARRDFERALELRPGYPEALSFLDSLKQQTTAGPAAHVM